MVSIKCPKCGEVITLGKDEYNSLLAELEQEEISKRVNERVLEVKKAADLQLKLEVEKLESTQNKEISNLNNELISLKTKLENTKTEKDLAIAKALEESKNILAKRQEEILNLKNEFENFKNQATIKSTELKSQYEFELKAKDSEIQKWKDYRMGDSTKDLGESLEKYCSDLFEEARPYAFPDAEFGKDNISTEEGKGDYIFRDFVEGIESVSIMFEMKTEKDTTKTKHKNSEFLAKLDANRKSKNCEYAVLVTTLESDSKVYDKGIVDVSYKYPKTFIIRPQYFITIIGLIRNMARANFEDKKQLIEYQQQNIDITNFENTVKAVAEKIRNDYEKATSAFESADDFCDKIIARVEDFRKSMHTMLSFMDKAQKQIPNLEIKKLTRNNKTMKEKFADLSKNKEIE